MDDKSTDDSIQIINDLIKDDPRFKLYENETNYGCGYTKRRCAELAIGEICGFVDPDDAITPDALKKMKDAHQLNPLVSLVHSSFVFCNEKLEKGKNFKEAKQVEVTEYFINGEGAVSHFATFKRGKYNESIGIDASLRIAVDQDLYLKLSETGKFYFLDEVLYYYRIHNKGISTSNSMKAFYVQLKVIFAAEKRRGISLEKEIEAFLYRVALLANDKKMENPGYLLLKLKYAIRKYPTYFVDKLFKREAKK